jgi:hypothetical protein
MWLVLNVVGRGLRRVVFFGLRWRGIRGRHFGGLRIVEGIVGC